MDYNISRQMTWTLFNADGETRDAGAVNDVSVTVAI